MSGDDVDGRGSGHRQWAERPTADAVRASQSADRNLRPRDAAALVIVDDSHGEPHVLMGRRRLDLAFLPGKFVFPGGRVDPADRRAPASDDLSPKEAAKLLVDMRGAPSLQRARSLALAAIRETFEETGIAVGRPLSPGIAAKAPEQGPWQAFYAAGIEPSLAPLSLLARAITPPGAKRRYDTRFFHVSAAAIARTLPSLDDELTAIDWYPIEEARNLDTISITRAILEDLADRLEASRAARPPQSVPFYYFQGGTFRRDLIES